MTGSYLLDTSALSSHLLRGLGHAFVADCMRKGAGVSALTVFEFGTFLKRRGLAVAEIADFWASYRGCLRHVYPVDEAVAALALRLRFDASERLPLADACIAACAAQHSLTLLHADDHFAVLPPTISNVDIRKI